ncbi:MAG TPA: response regulator [Polyangia bacterium]|nr:response regulator [Polyangia bacterium]
MSATEKLLAEFARSAPALAAEVRAAVESGDRERARSALYRLRTQAAALGQLELARFARTLEEALGRAGVELLRAGADALAQAVRALAAGQAPPQLEPGPLLPPPPAARGAPVSSSDDAVWTPTVDADMVEPFIEETGQRLDGLAQKLLRLETAPHDLDLVREILRDLHTVKGSSAFVGLRKLNRVAHTSEDLLQRVRDGALPADRAVIDALLGAGDVMREILERAAAGRSIDVDVGPALARLHIPGTFAAPPAEAEAAATPAPAPAAAPAGAPSRGEKGTLRVDFEKLDLLLNLVGELVLGRNAFGSALGGLGSLGREIEAQRRMARRAGTSARVTANERKALLRALSDELGRTSRVFEETTQDLDAAVLRLHHISEELRDQVMKLRMVPMGRTLTKYHRTVRELGYQLGKRVRLELQGADTELDKLVVEQLDEPLLHLVRNAIDHGIEAPEERRKKGKPPEGLLKMRAFGRGNQIVLEISDDGVGIDAAKVRRKAEEKQLLPVAELAALSDEQVVDLIFRPGFSTAPRVSEISGRGVGMDVVRETLTRLKGTVEVSSRPDQGTRFVLKLPLTLAIIQVLLVRAGGELLALPLDLVVRTLEIPRAGVRRLYAGPSFRLAERDIPLLSLTDALGLLPSEEREPEQPLLAVLTQMHGELFGLLVDRFDGKREIVIKGLGRLLEEVPCAAGATLIGERVVLIVDLQAAIAEGLRRLAPARAQAAPKSAPASPPAPVRESPAHRILLVEDSDVVRRTLARTLRQAGYDVIEARDGLEALELASRTRFDLVSTDVAMPNLDGYELTRRLRARPDYRHVPILMVTARAERIDRVRGFDAGVDEYIVKPLDRAELLRAVGKHLKERDASIPVP